MLDPICLGNRNFKKIYENLEYPTIYFFINGNILLMFSCELKRIGPINNYF